MGLQLQNINSPAEFSVSSHVKNMILWIGTNGNDLAVRGKVCSQLSGGISRAAIGSNDDELHIASVMNGGEAQEAAKIDRLVAKIADV